jgi:hypothetical protein
MREFMYYGNLWHLSHSRTAWACINTPLPICFLWQGPCSHWRHTAESILSEWSPFILRVHTSHHLQRPVYKPSRCGKAEALHMWFAHPVSKKTNSHMWVDMVEANYGWKRAQSVGFRLYRRYPVILGGWWRCVSVCVVNVKCVVSDLVIMGYVIVLAHRYWEYLLATSVMQVPINEDY